MENDSSIKVIKSLISRNKMKEAITQVDAFISRKEVDSEIEKSFILLKNRFSNYDQRSRLGLKVDEKNRNEVVYSLLDVLSYLEKNSSLKEVNPSQEKESVSLKNKVKIENNRKRNMSNFFKISIIMSGISIVVVFGASSSTMLYLLLLLLGGIALYYFDV